MNCFEKFEITKAETLRLKYLDEENKKDSKVKIRMLNELIEAQKKEEGTIIGKKLKITIYMRNSTSQELIEDLLDELGYTAEDFVLASEHFTYTGNRTKLEKTVVRRYVEMVLIPKENKRLIG
jgi:hypothetical protein